MDSSALPKSGDVIGGKYRIDAVIGSGGMGIVVRGLDTSLNRPVAIKFLAPERLMRAGAVARFLREARAAASIQSEHVVRVFEVSTLPDGAPFIVMECLAGLDLAQELERRGALPIEEACDHLLQACEAIGEAHARGIVHRDLKPQNLFLTRRADGSPFVKVLDFGISKTIEEGTANLTSTDTVMGTPLYMSPEQVRSLKNVDARADIWALGAILFELLTMAPVFEAPTASALAAMIAMDPPVPLRARRPQAPPELEALILRCLHKDPAGRFQNVGAFAEALLPFASERGRASAMRLSSIGSRPVDTAPPAAVASMAATAGARLASFPPAHWSAPLAYQATVAVPQPIAPVPTTLDSWQHANPPSNGSNVGLFIGLGVMGVVVVAGIAGGGAYFSARKTATPTIITVTADAGAPTPAATTSIAPLVSTAPAVPSSAPTSTPMRIRDAGASAKDAGPNAEDEHNATLGRAAEQQCKFHTDQMDVFARDNASRERAATSAKGFMCRGLASSRCERQTCKEACLILKDQPCLQQINYVIEHGPPPKY